MQHSRYFTCDDFECMICDDVPRRHCADCGVGCESMASMPRCGACRIKFNRSAVEGAEKRNAARKA